MLDARGLEYNAAKDVELEFLMDADAKELDLYKISEIFDP